jgi:hypothetical protein
MLHAVDLLDTVPRAVSRGTGETRVSHAVTHTAQGTRVNKETELVPMAVLTSVMDTRVNASVTPSVVPGLVIGSLERVVAVMLGISVHTVITCAVLTVSEEHVMQTTDIVLGAVQRTGQGICVTVSYIVETFK